VGASVTQSGDISKVGGLHSWKVSVISVCSTHYGGFVAAFFEGFEGTLDEAIGRFASPELGN
jgi:hypothetical protein